MDSNRDQQPNPPRSSFMVQNRPGLTKWELLVVLGIIAILVALLLPSVERGRVGSPRTQCRNNLKQIGLALHNYHDAYDSFPPAYTVDRNGKPLHSWRTLILPYVDQQALLDSIDLSKPWDDPVNATACKTKLEVYRCPSAVEIPSDHTTYLGLIGPDRGLLPTDSRRLSHFVNTLETLMAIEVSPDHATHWMAPQDDDGTFLLSLSEKYQLAHSGGLQTLRADGSVHFVDADMSQKERRHLLSFAKSKPTTEGENQPWPYCSEL
jgi:type II secretory pathway pseudopilin PulG